MKVRIKIDVITSVPVKEGEGFEDIRNRILHEA